MKRVRVEVMFIRMQSSSTSMPDNNRNFKCMIMKQVKLGAVDYQMLLELSKHAKKKSENFLGDLISTEYGKKK